MQVMICMDLVFSSTINCYIAFAFINVCLHPFMSLILKAPMQTKSMIFFSCSRYYDLVDPQNGILKKGREIFLTGCFLRTATEGSGYPRLLPTEYLVILLDEVAFKFLSPIISSFGYIEFS